MVDLEWIAFKLTEKEKSDKQAQWRRKHELSKPMQITCRFIFNGYSMECSTDVSNAIDLAVWLKEMEKNGFSKPEYGKKDKPETFAPQTGIVQSVKPTDKKWNNKPLYAVSVKLQDGNLAEVNVFNPTEYRKGDEVSYLVNDKGYPKIEMYGGEQNLDDVPF